MLKPKVASMGFNKKELQGIAAKIADNLKSEEEAAEEDVEAEISQAIELYLPILSISQSQANRLLDEWKKNHPTRSDEDDEDDEEEDITPVRRNQSKGNTNKTSDGNKAANGSSEEMKLLLETINSLKSDIQAMKQGKTSDDRAKRLEALLKDTGSYGNRTLKSFRKMSFKDDDEFEEFITEVEDDLKAYNQERANEGLSTLGVPPGATATKQKKDDVLTDAEIDAIANMY
jgi:hypothetical protein